MISNNQTFYRVSSFKDYSTGLLICCAGFEDRAISLPKKIIQNECQIEKVALFEYLSQMSDNKSNFILLHKLLEKNYPGKCSVIEVDATNPLLSYEKIKKQILKYSDTINQKKATIDISGMTHMWALGVIHACMNEGFEIDIVYTEAMSYFPLQDMAKPLLNAWRTRDYEIAEKFLQSAALMAVHILPDFAGNFRPGHPSCLIVFAGYEPNRLEGLVDSYAPGALIVIYGQSPRQEHLWRMELSKKLHRQMFSNFPLREEMCSTLSPIKAIEKLEDVFSIISNKYDISISPHCSKMQGVASYVFWKKHPEIQLIFTSPARFKPSQYSEGIRGEYIFKLTEYLSHG